MEETLDVLHVAARFYSDEGNKVVVIPTTDIDQFDINKTTNEPYYIKRYDDDSDNFHLSPAEVLSVGSKFSTVFCKYLK